MADNTLDNIRKHLQTLRLERVDQALDEQLAAAPLCQDRCRLPLKGFI